MSHRITLAALALAPLFFAACDDDDDPIEPPANATVDMLDDCDPTTFNAALGEGTCTGDGTTTYAEFTLELETTGDVDAWYNDPATLMVEVGQAIAATNRGGEEHTFTEVEEYGGGIVDELNEPSGNPDPAPECLALAEDDHVAPGATYVTEEESEAGVEHYQCCIHPWMRTDVTVVEP